MFSSKSSSIWDLESLISILFVLGLAPLAHHLTGMLMPSSASSKYRYLFMWHVFDALIHIIVEGSFLFECFFSYANASGSLPFFLGSKNRIYGPAFGKWPSSRLWQEYAKADHRWATADPTVVSIELVTVFLGGPMAVYACYLLHTSLWSRQNNKRRLALGRFWIITALLATMELYGGFMTFVPEFLTLCSRLDWKNPIYLVIYLIGFNGIWVVCPLLVLQTSFKEVQSMYSVSQKN